MAASRAVQMRFLVRPDCAKCVIAQKAAAARADNRRIACGTVGMTHYMGDLLPGQRILAPVAEGCLLGRTQRAESPVRPAPISRAALPAGTGRDTESSALGQPPGSFRAYRIGALEPWLTQRRMQADYPFLGAIPP
jgi:hypothetical protein